MVQRNPSDNSKKSGSLILLLLLAGLTGGPVRYSQTNQGSNKTPQPTLVITTSPTAEAGDMPRGGREELATQLKDALKAIEKSIELPYGLGEIKIDLSNPYSVLFYVAIAVIPAIKNILNTSKETAKTREAKKALEKTEERLKEFLETTTAKRLIDYYKHGKIKDSSDVFLLVSGHHFLKKLAIEISLELSLWVKQYQSALKIEQIQAMNEIIDNFEKVSKLPLDEINPEKLKRDLDTFLEGLRRLTEKKHKAT